MSSHLTKYNCKLKMKQNKLNSFLLINKKNKQFKL